MNRSEMKLTWFAIPEGRLAFCSRPHDGGFLLVNGVGFVSSPYLFVTWED